MTTADVLGRAADLVEEGWTQDTFAEDEYGNGCDWSSEEAVVWCVSGAIRAAAGPGGPYKLALAVLRQEIGPRVAAWNDDPDRTQAEVVATLRAAARRAI